MNFPGVIGASNGFLTADCSIGKFFHEHLFGVPPPGKGLVVPQQIIWDKIQDPCRPYRYPSMM